MPDVPDMPDVPEIPPKTRAAIDKVRGPAAGFAAERGLSDITKVCNYLPVALELRPLSLTYLPAELPGGSRLGEAIDRYFADKYVPPASSGGGGLLGRFRRDKGGGPAVQQREAELAAKRKVLNDAYDQLVATSPAYVAHLHWLERLGLSQVQFKRRPTLREMFVYADRSARQELMELETVANAARSRPATGKKRDHDQAVMEYVYADEYDRDYLQGLGRLLGYPQCCVERYTADRLSGRNVEQRAWEQVREMHERGRPIDVHAYFVKDFFPCVPDCPQAVALGRQYAAAYEALGEDFAEIYTGALYQAFEYVRNYPLLIERHKQRLLSKGTPEH